MKFETEINFPDGRHYDINIEYNYFISEEDEDPPETVTLHIIIGTKVNKSFYYMDRIDLIYDLKSREYLTIKNIEDRILYAKIIEMLDSSYGSSWGYEEQ